MTNKVLLFKGLGRSKVGYPKDFRSKIKCYVNWTAKSLSFSFSFIGENMESLASMIVFGFAPPNTMAWHMFILDSWYTLSSSQANVKR